MFSGHFSFAQQALVNFVGGGGKTALIQKLMDEYSEEGAVLYTTTMRIHPPDTKTGITVIAGDNTFLIKKILAAIATSFPERHYKIAATRHFMSPHLLRGVSPDFTDDLDRSLFAVIFNEADGAAGFSLKMPRDNEPVLMHNGQYLVPVIGIDCLGQPLGLYSIFRWQECSETYSLAENEPITAELAARILMHDHGVCKAWHPGMEIIPFINKVDHAGQVSQARELAECILHNPDFPVKRVLYGSVHHGTVASVSIP